MLSFPLIAGFWFRAFIGKTKYPQDVSIGVECGTTAIIQHEMLHLLGFAHEQCRPDRDGYVQIKKENINPSQPLDFFHEAVNFSNSQLQYNMNQMSYGN